MLVITRKEGERIVVDDDIVITVVESKRGSVKIGIAAPRKLSIMREDAHPVEVEEFIGALCIRADGLWRLRDRTFERDA